MTWKKLLCICIKKWITVSFVFMLSFFTLAILLFSAPTSVMAASTDHTEAEAVAWIREQADKSVKYGECVYLAKAYYVWLGYDVPYGDGNSYANPDKIMPGWWVDNNPTPGSIYVEQGITNHVSLVYAVDDEGTIYTVDTNINESPYAAYFPWKSLRTKDTYYGKSDKWFVHPKFKSYADLGEEFYAEILNTAYGKTISKVSSNDKIYLKNEDGSSGQVWKFIRQSDGAYVICSYLDGKVLEMTDGIQKTGTQISAQGDFWGGNYQQWYLISQGDGYIFLSKHYTDEEWVMENSDGDNSDGNAIQINKRNNTADQIWTVNKDWKAESNSHNLTDSRESTRYTVLLLDVSGPQTFEEKPNYMNLLGTTYTSDSSIEYVKSAANKFLSDAKKDIGNNYIAIVTYSEEAKVVSGFTKDIDKLQNLLNEVEYVDSNRSIYAGLECAAELLNSVPSENTTRNLLLCTTGLTDIGEYEYEGHYNADTRASSWANLDSHIKLYAYANSAIKSADKIKENGTNIYVIGLFDPVEAKMPSTSALRDVTSFLRLTASDIASSPDHFYPVSDVNTLDFYFGQMEEELTGTTKIKIYNGSDNYVKEEYSDDIGGALGKSGHYEEMLWGPALFEIPSTQMFGMDISSGDSANWNLAMLAGSLCTTAYNHEYLVQAYLDLGCKKEDIFLYSYPDSEYNRKNVERDGKEGFSNDNDLAFSIASRPMTISGREYDLIFITLRGTSNLHEAREDATQTNQSMFYDYHAWSWPLEFYRDVLAGLTDYTNEHSNMNEKPIKVFITGHSLAGAAANLVAAFLNKMCDDEMISSDILTKNDIYAYTFGAIDSITDSVLSDENYYQKIPATEGYENIINIYNLLDNFGSGTFYGDVLSSQKVFGKFGQFYLFENNMEDYFKPVRIFEDLQIQHGMVGYLQALRDGCLHNRAAVGRIIVRICCPVDVDVLYEDNVVCSIKNDEAEIFSSDVKASVSSGEKTIVLPANSNYQLKMTATDSGTMQYYIQDLGLPEPEVVSFSNIELHDGKLMETYVPDWITNESIKIFSVDESGEKITEIFNNGSEKLVKTVIEPTLEIVTPEPSITVSEEDNPASKEDISGLNNEDPIVTEKPKQRRTEKEDLEQNNSNTIIIWIFAIMGSVVLVVISSVIVIKKINRKG